MTNILATQQLDYILNSQENVKLMIDESAKQIKKLQHLINDLNDYNIRARKYIASSSRRLV